MINQKEYLKFIADRFPKAVIAYLKYPVEYKGKKVRAVTKLGPVVGKLVNISNLTAYSRSIEVNLKWDKGEDKLLIYCNSKKSPSSIYNEVLNRITKVVNDSYTDDELMELRREELNKLSKIFKNL